MHEWISAAATQSKSVNANANSSSEETKSSVSSSPNDGFVVQKFKYHQKYVVSCLLSHCGTYFASASHDQNVCVFAQKTKQPVDSTSASTSTSVSTLSSEDDTNKSAARACWLKSFFSKDKWKLLLGWIQKQVIKTTMTAITPRPQLPPNLLSLRQWEMTITYTKLPGNVMFQIKCSQQAKINASFQTWPKSIKEGKEDLEERL